MSCKAKLDMSLLEVDLITVTIYNETHRLVTAGDLWMKGWLHNEDRLESKQLTAHLLSIFYLFPKP